jgi:hypothetical protein
LPLSKADDADWIIAIACAIAKHPAMDGRFGPMSGWERMAFMPAADFA